MASRAPHTLSKCARCLRATSRSACQTRLFTSTSRWAAQLTLPTFERTSSPELDDVLATLRNKVFLPSQLAKPQRDLIYKTTRHPTLKENPISIQNGDEEIRLEPILPQDRPRISRTLLQIIDLMKSPDDFRNMPKVLEGLKMAKVGISAGAAAKIARKANNMGIQEVIIHCARAVRRTGFSLCYPDVAEEAMFGAHLVAQKGEWTKEALDLAFKNASDLASMMNQEGHSWKTTRSIRRYVQRHLHPDSQPHIIGILLELSAIQALKFHRGKDTQGRASDYANKLVATWGNYPWPDESSDWRQWHSTLTRWVAAWNGIKMALQVKDVGGKEELSRNLVFLDEQLRKAREVVMAAPGDAKRRRGINLYDEFSNMSI